MRGAASVLLCDQHQRHFGYVVFLMFSLSSWFSVFTVSLFYGVLMCRIVSGVFSLVPKLPLLRMSLYFSSLLSLIPLSFFSTYGAIVPLAPLRSFILLFKISFPCLSFFDSVLFFLDLISAKGFFFISIHFLYFLFSSKVFFVHE